MQKKELSIHVKSILFQLRDVRVIGLIGFGVIAVLVTWSGIRVLQSNFELQERIVSLEQEVVIQELENTNLALRNEYYNTDQFLELQARRQFGLAAPGETVLMVPKSVALANSVPVTELEQEASIIEDPKPAYQLNLEAWMRFFFRGVNETD
ncbi:hypothetical protein BH23PAT2_BH23PAT2_06950 [soil metagenome]